MKTPRFLPLFAFVSLLGIAPSPAAKHRLEGAWRIAEVASADGSVNRSPQPGLLIFTQWHFSHVRVTASTARTAVTDPDQATARELVAVWGNRSFIANSGTYAVAADTLILRPLVAKNPAVMRSGFSITYSLEFSGDSMRLREIRDSDELAVNPPKLTFVRVE